MSYSDLLKFHLHGKGTHNLLFFLKENIYYLFNILNFEIYPLKTLSFQLKSL